MLWKSFSGQVYWNKQILLFIMKDLQLNLDVSCLILFCYFINGFFNGPNFVLETPICPVISDGARFIGYVSCFRTLSRLFSAPDGTGPLCHISSFSTSRDVWLGRIPVLSFRVPVGGRRGDPGLEVGFRNKQSGFEPWPGLFCCVFGQAILPWASQCPSEWSTQLYILLSYWQI